MISGVRERVAREGCAEREGERGGRGMRELRGQLLGLRGGLLRGQLRGQLRELRERHRPDSKVEEEVGLCEESISWHTSWTAWAWRSARARTLIPLLPLLIRFLTADFVSRGIVYDWALASWRTEQNALN